MNSSVSNTSEFNIQSILKFAGLCDVKFEAKINHVSSFFTFNVI